MTLQLASAFAASLRMLRERTVVSLGLGAAVVLSLLSVCCGLGLFTTPWFMCELYAVQIALCARAPVTRGWSFVSAALILLGAVLMIVGVAAITLLGAAPELSFESGLVAALKSGGLTALIGSMVALLIAAPWLYAPLILLEQQTRFDLALVESVRLVVTRGVFVSVRLSLCAHALQASPLLVALGVALLVKSSQLVVFALVAAPLLCLSVPVGQGMLVWAYVQQREPAAPIKVIEPRTRSKPTSSERYARAWTLLMVLPIASLLLLELSLLRPSRVPLGAAPEGELLAELAPVEGSSKRVILPNTALEVVAGAHSARVVASDGGGVGDLPLTAAEPIARVRVVRVRNQFALELQQGGRAYTTLVDRAGVRMDDDLRARLLDRVSPLQLALFMCAWLSTGIASVPVLYSLGQGRRRMRVAPEQQARTLRRARNVALVLLPLSLACFAVAVLALLGD